tara:strand:- start:42 stop:545 length:504 start_codon:yes stop_codon:yes gene_type:complete
LRLNKRMTKDKTKDKEKKSLGRRIGMGCLWIFVIFIILIIIIVMIGNHFDKGMHESYTKSEHKRIVGLIKEEIKKCKLGAKKYFDGNQMCPATPENVISGIINRMGRGYNPANEHEPAYRASDSNTNNEDLGIISFSVSGSNLVIKSCHRKSCKKEDNRQTSTMSIE